MIIDQKRLLGGNVDQGANDKQPHIYTMCSSDASELARLQETAGPHGRPLGRPAWPAGRLLDPPGGFPAQLGGQMDSKRSPSALERGSASKKQRFCTAQTLILIDRRDVFCTSAKIGLFRFGARFGAEIRSKCASTSSQVASKWPPKPPASPPSAPLWAP